MNGFFKSGFSLIELVIALVILGLLAAITVPTLRTFLAKDDRKTFLTELNSVVSNALETAILSDKMSRVVFDLVNKKVFVEEQSGKKLPGGKLDFVPITERYVQNQFDWSKINFEIKNFYIDTKDEMILSVGQIRKEKVWFYILPDATAQPVILNIIDLNENLSQSESQFSLVLNPFSVQFKMYEKL
ncbi:hypothetical protein A3F66_06480 [candidate division TM6 bacterium RIFCSPHIGHO2_12_FULL_32_22]|nr:MAG: hypothetical protein A3F66_06480 [candidate division TM6 bacterium RIFCSPHIGHO2_12_FULL_32_22]